MANANSTDFIGAGQEALRQGRFTDAERWLGQALQTAPALGIPAWVMLPPTRRRRAPVIRLFRRTYGDWRAVVEQIDQALAAALAPS
ncbi:MAG: hypothetical protein KGQ82_07130 [Alphaproteobacteria bacterium]|nr:hypothetical protein [Alphaproteobacteria bacterium]